LKKNLSDEDIDKIIENATVLEKLQEEKQDPNVLPKVGLSEIEKKKKKNTKYIMKL